MRHPLLGGWSPDGKQGAYSPKRWISRRWTGYTACYRWGQAWLITWVAVRQVSAKNPLRRFLAVCICPMSGGWPSPAATAGPIAKRVDVLAIWGPEWSPSADRLPFLIRDQIHRPAGLPIVNAWFSLEVGAGSSHGRWADLRPIYTAGGTLGGTDLTVSARGRYSDAIAASHAGSSSHLGTTD